MCVLSVERGYLFCEYMRLPSPIGINQSLPVGRMGNDRSTRPICLSCVLLFASSLISANDNQAIGTEVVTETITDPSFPFDRANPSESIDGFLQSLQTSTEERILPTAVTILDDTYTPNNEFERTEKMPDAKGLSVLDMNDIILENIKEKDAGEAIKLLKRHTIGCLPDEVPATRFPPHLEHQQISSCNEEALKFDHEYPTGVIIHEMFCETNKLLHYLVVAGKNLNSEFLPLLPLPFNIVEGEVKNVLLLRNILLNHTLFEIMEQSLGSLEIFLEDSEKLVVLFDTLKNCIPLSSIRESLSTLRIAIQKFLYHIRGFAIDLGPLYSITVDMDILGELGEIFVVVEETLLKMFFENLPSSFEMGLNPFNLLSEVVSVVEFLYKNFSAFINSDTFYRIAIFIKRIADTMRGFYCGFYASGFPQIIGFAPTSIGNFIPHTCKAPNMENGKGHSPWFPNIPGNSWTGHKMNGECPICPDLPPPDISSVNAGMHSSTPQSVIASLEALPDSLASNVRNGIINTFPFQPKWSANNAEPSSLGSSLTNNPTGNEPFPSLKLSSASLQQAVPSPSPIPTDMPPLNNEPPPSDLSRPTALPPNRNSAADKYDQLLPDAPATETYDDPSEFAYSPTSKAIENSQDEGNSDANIPLFPPLPLFSGGSSGENGSSIESIDTPQSESSDTNPIDRLKAHQPILQSLFSVPQVGRFQRDTSAQASENSINSPQKIASFYKHLYPHLQRLEQDHSGSTVPPNIAEKILANPCGTLASLPSVSNLNNVLKGVAGLQFPLQFPRNEISSALGNVVLTPGDAVVIIIQTNGLVLIGRIVDTVSPISFNVDELNSMSRSSQDRAAIWHLRSRDLSNPICEQQLKLLSQS